MRPKKPKKPLVEQYRQAIGEHANQQRTRINITHNPANTDTNLWEKIYIKWRKLSHAERIGYIIIGLLLTGCSLYLAYQLAPLIYQSIASNVKSSPQNPSKAPTKPSTYTDERMALAQSLVSATKELVTETRNQEMPIYFDADKGIVGKASQKTLMKYDPLTKGMHAQRDYVLATIIKELKTLQQTDAAFEQFCLDHPNEVANVIEVSMSKLYTYLSAQYSKGTCGAYARTIEILARECLVKSVYLAVENLKHCSYKNDFIDDHMSVLDDNGSLRIDLWTDRSHPIYVDHVNDAGTAWPLSKYQCKKTILQQSTSITNQGPSSFNKWAMWALEKVENVATENLIFGYMKFNQVCQALRNNKETIPAQTLVRHHLFCQHPKITTVKNNAATSRSIDSIALTNMQIEMLNGLANNHFQVYKHEIFSILADEHPNLEIPKSSREIIETLASITASAAAVEMTHLSTEGMSAATSMGKFIAAHLLYNDAMPILIAISTLDHVVLFTVDSTPTFINQMREFEQAINTEEITANKIKLLYLMRPGACENFVADPLAMIYRKPESVLQVKIIYPTTLQQPYVTTATNFLFKQKTQLWNNLLLDKQEDTKGVGLKSR